MLFVLLSCAGIPGCGFFTWLMGWIGNSSGLGAAFYIVPACYAGLAVLAGYAWKKQKKQNQILSRQIVLNKAE
jgi:fucose permease